MKILITEDYENKRKQLVQYILDVCPKAEVEVRRSYNSGLKEILAHHYDLILLDMTMPTFDIGTDEDGGRPQHYAGRAILRQMQRHNKTTPVIVVTQYDVFGEERDRLSRDQLHRQLYSDHSGVYMGMVYYNAAVEGWKNELRKLLHQCFPGDEFNA